MTKFEKTLLGITAVFLLLLGAVTARESRGLPLTGTETAPQRSLAAEEAPPLDINTATAEELCALPGVGETIAGRIVAWREEHGPFEELEDLMAVEGIGEKTMEDIYEFMEGN